jgi:uncharacterized protein
MFPVLMRLSGVSAVLLTALVGCAAAGSSQGEAPGAPGPVGQAAASGSAGGRTDGGTGSRDGQAAGSGTGPESRPANPPLADTALVIFGADTVKAEVARSSSDRSMGLMYRQSLAEGTGMLFVFERAEERSFWMQNTYVALDIAFIDSAMKIINIEQMEARTDDLHDSAGPALYALEVPKGWFAKKGIKAGATLKIVF